MGLPPESSSIRFCGRNRATTFMLLADMLATLRLVSWRSGRCNHEARVAVGRAVDVYEVGGDATARDEAGEDVGGGKEPNRDERKGRQRRGSPSPGQAETKTEAGRLAKSRQQKTIKREGPGSEGERD